MMVKRKFLLGLGSLAAVLAIMLFVAGKIVPETPIEKKFFGNKGAGEREEPPPLINSFATEEGVSLPSWYVELPPPLKTAPTIEIPEGEPPKPSFTDLGKIAEAIFLERPAPKTNDLLPLPNVSEGELSIDNEKGISDFEKYLEYFVANSKYVKFPYEKYASLRKTSPEEVFLPTALIDKALREKNFQGIHEGLLLAEEFIENKTSYMKAIKVRGEAVEISKKMVGLEMLTLDLIKNAFALEDGKISESGFLAFYGKYKNTAEWYNGEFRKKSEALALSKKDGFFHKIAELLGIKPFVARAVIFPFGGIIAYVERTQCSCTGMLLTVGPPSGGAYFLYWTVYASPAIFLYKAIHEGAYILGTHLPATGYCGVPEAFCAGSIVGPSIVIAGTSP